jgi:hypothetical protein
MKAYIFSKPEIKKEYYLGTEEVKNIAEMETTGYREYLRDKYNRMAWAAYCFGRTDPKKLNLIQRIIRGD